MINLKKIRTAKNVSQAKVAEDIGISRQTYNNYELGKRQADYETLLKLAEYFEVTVEELLTDNPPAPRTDPIQTLIDTYDNILPITRRRFPMLGEIACGEPIFAEEDKEQFVMADMDISADFCLRAKGDSMIGARINDGDIVFIREMPIVDNGEIAAVIIDNEATLKRFYYDRDNSIVQLVAENPRYSPLVYSGEQLDHIRVLGKAVYFMSSL